METPQSMVFSSMIAVNQTIFCRWGSNHSLSTKSISMSFSIDEATPNLRQATELMERCESLLTLKCCYIVGTLLLNILEIKDQTKDSPGRLSLRGLAIAAGLSAEAIAPNRHVARAMTADFGLPVDFPVDFPKGKFATAT